MRKAICILVVIGLAMGAMVSAQTQWPLDTIQGVEYYRYTVEKSIGLYRISINFSVTQEEILEANPELMQRGVRYDEVILIPTHRAVQSPVVPAAPVDPNREEEAEMPKAQEPMPPFEVPLTSVPEQTPDSAVWDSMMDIDTASVIRMALLLPLQADMMRRQQSMDRFYDFYVGVLLAVNEIQQTGQAVELYVYDTGKSISTISTILADSGVIQSDVVIGPAFAAQVDTAAQWAERNGKRLVIPFLPDVPMIATNPYLIQFNPSDQVEADVLASYLKSKQNDVRCIFIDADEDKIPADILTLRRSIETHGVPVSQTTIHAIMVDSIAGVLEAGKENIFLFNTEKYSNIRSLIPHLVEAYHIAPITLLSRYSWQKEKIILPQLYTSIFHAHPQPSASYQAAFDTYFHHSLSSLYPRYDLLGYDIVYQLLCVLSKEKNPQDSAEGVDMESLYQGMQSDIHYQRVAEGGGYQNRHVQIVHQ